jgi:uncharacterized damage-inducible protein DinB
MTTAQLLTKELQQEAANNKKILDRIPEAQLLWKPHEKSMTIGRLGMHIAELPGWIVRCLTADEYDLGAGPYIPNVPESRAQIMAEFEKTMQRAMDLLSTATDETLEKNWKLRRGEIVIQDMPRSSFVRRQFGHMSHHRGQLSVFLRLLNVPVPALYGPSADERT